MKTCGFCGGEPTEPSVVYQGHYSDADAPLIPFCSKVCRDAEAVRYALGNGPKCYVCAARIPQHRLQKNTRFCSPRCAREWWESEDEWLRKAGKLPTNPVP